MQVTEAKDLTQAEIHSFAEGALTISVEGSVSLMTLNRPEKRNAINSEIWRALPVALAQIERQSNIKVLVICGAGDHFASGADINEFGKVFADQERAINYAQQMVQALDALANLDKPSIAMIAGSCVGGGLAIALACDLRIASRASRFGVTPAKLGLMYSLNDTKRLADLVGPSVAKDMLYTGRLIEAADALAKGLINEAHDGEILKKMVMEKAALISAASQWSVRKTKKIIRLIAEGQSADTVHTKQWFVDAIKGVDYAEGYAAFLEKRKPVFPFI
jgi:enoyl-CoA hydratase/carnithine racemase